MWPSDEQVADPERAVQHLRDWIVSDDRDPKKAALAVGLALGLIGRQQDQIARLGARLDLMGYEAPGRTVAEP